MVKIRVEGGRHIRDFRCSPPIRFFLFVALAVALGYLCLLWVFVDHVGPMGNRLEDLGGDTKKLHHRKSRKGVEKKTSNAITIGYAVSVTGCGSDPITEGGAVLKHSVHLTSIHGNMGGRYDYKFYAIYHPDAEECASTLADLGYTMLRRDTPVSISDIKGDFLRSRIQRNGCCGEKELIKLEAYTLTDHPLVVHLDLDVLVLKPMDPIFDLMLGVDPSTANLSKVPIMWPDIPVPQRINAIFTRDYNMVPSDRKFKPVQGGFIVLRPNIDVYREFTDIIREGDFREGSGWGGEIGLFHGSMTFQGIVPYYYDVVHPGLAVELNRCVYNQMCDNPRNRPTIKDVVSGDCLTGQVECEDCRNRPLEDVVSTHFTLCQKPWMCFAQDANIIQQRLCRKLHHEWFRIRSDLEKSWGRSGWGSHEWQRDHFYGFCSREGPNNYERIKVPYG